MAAFEPATIIHLAAQPLVSVAFESPIETFETNVMGTANILEISRNLESVQSVGIVTTDKVYRNLETGNPFTEESELGGNEPYSASKVGAEAAISAWRSLNTGSSGYKLLALRSGNVIGGGDDARDRLIPDLAKNAFLGAPLKIRNYESTRPWQHVLDPLFGYLQALNYAAGKEIYNHAFNFGPIEPSLSVRKVVEIFHQEIGSNLMWDNIPSNPSFHESVSLELNSENSQKLLKWSPVWSQENSIRRSARWWQKYYQQRITASEITLNEISQYITALSDRED
jgi:CDP-glucose 4,6-dehydratase